MGCNAGWEESEVLCRTLLSRQSDPFVRLGAAGSLGKLQSAAGQPGVNALTTALRQDRDLNVRRRSAASLGQLAPVAGSDAVATLAHVVSTETDTQLKWRAIESIGLFGEVAGDRGVSALIASLRDADVGVRLRAAGALASVGEVAGSDGVEALLTAYRSDRSHSVREQAKKSLVCLRDSAAETLNSSLHDYQRGRAAWILGEMGEEAGQVALESLVVAAIHEPLSYVRRRVIEALGRMGTEGGCLIFTALHRARGDPDDYIQVKVAHVLETLSGDAFSQEAIEAAEHRLALLLNEHAVPEAPEQVECAASARDPNGSIAGCAGQEGVAAACEEGAAPVASELTAERPAVG